MAWNVAVLVGTPALDDLGGSMLPGVGRTTCQPLDWVANGLETRHRCPNTGGVGS